MDWISFIGAFVGGVLGIFAVGIGLEFWDQLKLRKQKQTGSDKTSVPTPDDILESHLEQYIVQDFPLCSLAGQFFQIQKENNQASAIVLMQER